MARSTKPAAARPITPEGGTVKVRSTIHIGGLIPGQIAEVDDNVFTRGLLTQGMWQLLVEPEVLSLTGSGAPVDHEFNADLVEAQPEEI